MARTGSDGAPLFGTDADDAAHLVQPERAIRCFDDAGDRSESLSRIGDHGSKSSIAETRQSQFATEPLVRPPSANDPDAPDVDPIPARKCGHASAIEKFDMTGRIAEPQPSARIGEGRARTVSHQTRRGLVSPAAMFEVNEPEKVRMNPQATVVAAH